jgi:hypothetical protein
MSLPGFNFQQDRRTVSDLGLKFYGFTAGSVVLHTKPEQDSGTSCASQPDINLLRDFPSGLALNESELNSAQPTLTIRLKATCTCPAAQCGPRRPDTMVHRNVLLAPFLEPGLPRSASCFHVRAALLAAWTGIPRIAVDRRLSWLTVTFAQASFQRFCRRVPGRHPWRGAATGNMPDFPIHSPGFGRASPTGRRAGQPSG